MDRQALPAGFGALLRRWRQQRRHSQQALSFEAGVSARHLSWLESGKAQPSRAMVLRLAERLEVPLRERNAMLTAAGYAPMYTERPLDDAARALLQRLLDAHEPAPALAVDRHWNLVAHNTMLPLLLAGVAPALLAPPVNVLRLSLHPLGLAPQIAHLGAWRAHILARLKRQVQASGDSTLAALYDELQALPAPAAEPALPDDALAVPLTLHTPAGRLDFITTVTVFGAPHDVALSELAIETLLPADDATAAALQRLRGTIAP